MRASGYDVYGSILKAGRDPRADLARHDSYAALASADALIPARHTGANAADICIGLVR